MIRQFSVEETKFEPVKLVHPFVSTDERGAFVKDYSGKKLAELGVVHGLKEVFYTYSHKGVVRALHFQLVKTQPKLVRAVKGAIYDVVVDLRKGSSTFGKWQGFELNDTNFNELLIPSGFGHGYLVLEESIVSYKCSEDFYGEYDSGIRWDDPDIAIAWPLNRVDHQVILSEKDRNLMTLQKFKERYQGM